MVPVFGITLIHRVIVFVAMWTLSSLNKISSSPIIASILGFPITLLLHFPVIVFLYPSSFVVFQSDHNFTFRYHISSKLPFLMYNKGKDAINVG